LREEKGQGMGVHLYTASHAAKASLYCHTAGGRVDDTSALMLKRKEGDREVAVTVI
jgi:hypothetical protein